MKIILGILLSAYGLYADTLKISMLETKEIRYSETMVGTRSFSLLCINGYKWLQYGEGKGSISQMLEINMAGNARPIKCED